MTLGPGGRRSVRIAAELTVAFVVLTAADRWFTGGTAFVALQPNPLWIPVLVMALAYGTGPGVGAAAIATSIWLVHAHHGAGERDYLDHLFHLSLQPLLWFVTAAVVGEVTIIRAARHDRIYHRVESATRNVATMTEAFEGLSRTNRALQVRIATEARTVGHVIATATRLSSSGAADRHTAIAQLVALAVRTEDFTCYRIAGEETRCWIRGQSVTRRHDALPAVLIDRLRRAPDMVHVVRREDRAALHGVGVAALALSNPGGGDLIGCLVLHVLPFDALNAGRTAELNEVAAWLAPLMSEPARPASYPARAAGLPAELPAGLPAGLVA